jgi:hypothetical protein
MGRLLLLQKRLQVGYFALQLGRSVRRLLRHFKGHADETVSYSHDHLSGDSHSDPRNGSRCLADCDLISNFRWVLLETQRNS